MVEAVGEPLTGPIAGNQLSRTAKSQISTMAATKLGTAWPITVVTSILVQETTADTAEHAQRDPTPTMSTEAMATSSTVVPTRAETRSETVALKTNDSLQVAARGVAQPGEVAGGERIVEVVLLPHRLDRLRREGPASGQRRDGIPGVRYSDEKIRKLEARSVITNPRSLVIGKRSMSSASSGQATASATRGPADVWFRRSHIRCPGCAVRGRYADGTARDPLVHPRERGNVGRWDPHHVLGEHDTLGLGHELAHERCRRLRRRP